MTPSLDRRLDLGSILERGPAVIYTVDPATFAAMSVSANVERELGYCVQEFLADGGLWRSILHPDDAPGVFARFGELFEKGELRLEYRLRRKDGQWRWVRDELVLRCAADGKPVEIVGCAFDVEDSKRLEMARERESGLFRAFFRDHVAVMLVLDPQTLDILDANGAARAFYGWERGPAPSMNLRAICQDGPECARAVIDECRVPGQRVAVCRHLAAGGVVRDVDIRISRIAVGSRDVLFAVVSDITARVKAEEALKQSEARLRSLYENALEGIFQSTPEGRFLWANPALARILGYESPEDLRERVTDMAGQVYAEPEDRQAIVAAIRERGFMDRYEVRLRRPDGEIIWGASTCWAVRDESGRVTRIEGFLEDITARKRAEAERTLLAVASEQTSEGLAILGGNPWRVEYANPAFCAIAGIVRAKLLGRMFFEVFPGGGQGMPVLDITRSLAEGREWAGQFRHEIRDRAAMTLEAHFSPMRDEYGRVTNAVAVLRDVTGQALLERRLRRLRKLEAMGTLAGGIAHDFNNILTPIMLNAEIGLQDLAQEHALRAHLEEIIKGCLRARRLIGQIMAFSRRGDLRSARVELNPIVAQAVGLIREKLPPDVEARLTPCGERLHVMADASLLHQMVVNLADNALHAMRGRGGLLSVSLGARRVPPEPGAAAPLAAGDYAVLAVSDTGHGMDQAVLERIFIPFFTTKKPGEGTGMGLSTVHGIARSLGGAVRVESEVGKGSLFEVYLPLAGGSAPKRAAPPGRRALVADSQAFSRRTMGMLLSELGYKATMVKDASAALKAFSRDPGRFDAVISGQDPRGMSGHELLAACRALDAARAPESRARLVLLVDREDGGGGAAGADAVLVRPAGAMELAAALGVGSGGRAGAGALGG